MKIEIVDYDPRWPWLFEREADRIREALGERALRVAHAGSTSVPGLCAKPVIDIVLIVNNSADEPAYLPPLEQSGYSLRIREPEWHEHRMLKGPETDVNLHVFSEGCAEVDRVILFRDWLRDNAEDRDRYAKAKRELAGADWEDVDRYALAKTSVIEEILERARRGSLR